MTIHEFWDLIAVIDQELLNSGQEDMAVEPLIAKLSVDSEDTIDRFHEHLATVLYNLDGEQWYDEAGENDSGDSFLYARCFVVAKGKEFYQCVLNDPRIMPKHLEQWAEPLLYVSGQAWANITGNDELDYPRDASVSYESFSNKAQW
jgi:hypothetical protein